MRRACYVEEEGACERSRLLLREGEATATARGCCAAAAAATRLTICRRLRRRCRSLLPLPPSPLPPSLRPRDRLLADDVDDGDEGSDDEFRHCKKKKTAVKRKEGGNKCRFRRHSPHSLNLTLRGRNGGCE